MMILYIESPKDTSRKLLINEYTKVAGYKINTQKSHAFLYINSEKTEREIKEPIPFTIATKKDKILRNAAAAAAASKSLQLCLTPCDPIDGSPPGSPIPGILQARVLEWGAIAFSNI